MENLSYSGNREIMAIVSHFDLKGASVDNIEIFGAGRINKTFRITTKTGNTRNWYLLQNINHTVFPNTKELMNNVISVTEFVRRKGKTELEFIRCKSAADSDCPYLYIDNFGQHWRMYHYIDAVVYSSIIYPYQACMLGEAIADFTTSLEGYDEKRLFETILHFHHTPKRFEAFLISAVTHPQRVQGCEKQVEFVIERKDEFSTLVDALDSGEIPYRVVHNDPKLNNVLFDKETNAPICMIDLDTIMPGTGLYDVGDALRSIANTASEDDKTTKNVSFSIEIYEEFVKGYRKGMGKNLTARENLLIPISPWILSMELGMRFLKDHFDGNVYFKTDYDGQNIERANIQFALAEDIEKKMKDGLLNKT